MDKFWAGLANLWSKPLCVCMLNLRWAADIHPKVGCIHVSIWRAEERDLSLKSRGGFGLFLESPMQLTARFDNPTGALRLRSNSKNSFFVVLIRDFEIATRGSSCLKPAFSVYNGKWKLNRFSTCNSAAHMEKRLLLLQPLGTYRSGLTFIMIICARKNSSQSNPDMLMHHTRRVWDFWTEEGEDPNSLPSFSSN